MYRLRNAGLLLALTLPAWPTCSYGSEPVPSTIRVCLRHAQRTFNIGCTGSFNYQSGTAGTAIKSKGRQSVMPISGGSAIGNRRFHGVVTVSPEKPTDLLMLDGRRYRGVIQLIPAGRRQVDVVEIVSLDEYLQGVLPKEMGPEWPLEALKAQAVASRSYALAARAEDPDRSYDVVSDVHDQVYGGVESESPASNQAVRETHGQILMTRDGKPVQAFFHSSCGGRTEMPGDVWDSRASFLGFAPVSDSFCKEDPYRQWTLTLSPDSITRRLRRAGIRIGTVKTVKAVKRSSSDRVTQFLVAGSRGKAFVQGNRFRLALGPEILRSTLLTEISQNRKGFHFEGRGWGHGVGLCQWGARGRALAGQKHEEILKAYYSEASLVSQP